MTNTSNAIFTLCSHLCVGENVQPLEPKEWSQFAVLLGEKTLRPENLLGMSVRDMIATLEIDEAFANRLVRLIDRNASLSFELSKYESMGLYVLTRADESYPRRLIKKFGNTCPPIFYCAGDPTLLMRNSVGYVGSRSADESDTAFTKRTVEKTVSRGFSVVSGGAKGIDSISGEHAIAMGSEYIEYLSDSMMRKLKQSAVTRAIQDGKLLLLSVAKPDAGFNTGLAMMRNRYIYAQSDATVIIRSDYYKGGTWSGATENIRHGWCPTFCRNIMNVKGNMELIKKGAIPIDEDWNGDITVSSTEPKPEQMSLFR